jgi:hypothetical protein
MLFMILALSRGFVVQQFADFASFNALHALAEGDGGDAGGDSGSGAGDAGGDSGSGAGDAGGDSGAGAGDTGGDSGAGAGSPAGGDAGAAAVIGCMDPSASNYNPAATDQTGVICTYPVIGCMDPTATNFDPTATTQGGVICTYPTPVCILTINPDSIVAGDRAALAWGFSSDVTSLSINNGIGVKTSRSYQYVTPDTSTTYSGVATSPYGSATCSASVTVTPAPVAPPAPVYGCMDSTATNYNPAATSQTGVTCTYPVAPIIGCMDSSATNYNPAATSQTGVTCTYPAIPVPTCVLTANPTSVQTGSASTLSWVTILGSTFSIDQSIGSVTPVSGGSTSVTPGTTTTYTGTVTSAGGSSTCSATVTVTPTPPAPIYGCMDSSATNYNPAATSQTGVTCTYPPAPVYGCMDPAATNFNPSATSQTGVTCLYAPTCMLTSNPSSVQTGSLTSLSWTTTNASTFTIDNGVGAVTPVATGSVNSPTLTATTTFTGTATGAGGSAICTTIVIVTPMPPPPPAPVCALSATPSSIGKGEFSALSWTTSNATAFTIDNGVGAVTPIVAGSTSVSPAGITTYTGTATGAGGSATCSATISVSAIGRPGGGGGGSGGGGGGVSPTFTLSALPHVATQPLVFLYLSQIPYTGLDLGPIGTAVYWVVLFGFALAVAYFVLFSVAPRVNYALRNFGVRVASALNAQAPVPAPAASMLAPRAPSIHLEMTPEAPRGYSSYDGFKSFAQGGALSIEDIVKSLSRAPRSAPVAPQKAEPEAHIEPIYENVEPIYEHVEPVMAVAPTTEASSAPASTRGFASALVEGDREAVFAGLRQHVRGGGSPEQLLSAVTCLIDDVYRARIDSTVCDTELARRTARLDTPALEKLVTALSTAIDSSYTTGVTGAKLALTRALAVLGA